MYFAWHPDLVCNGKTKRLLLNCFVLPFSEWGLLFGWSWMQLKGRQKSFPPEFPLPLHDSSGYIMSFRLIFSYRWNCRATALKSPFLANLSLTCHNVLSQCTAALTLHLDSKGSCVPADCKSFLLTLQRRALLVSALPDCRDVPFSFLFSEIMKCEVWFPPQMFLKCKVGTNNAAAHSSGCDLWLSLNVLNWLSGVVSLPSRLLALYSIHLLYIQAFNHTQLVKRKHRLPVCLSSS